MKQIIHGKFQRLTRGFIIVSQSSKAFIYDRSQVIGIIISIYRNNKRLDFNQPLSKMLEGKRIKLILEKE